MPSLSQKYRPKIFAEITGQESITETLRKEVATGKLGHAYLFSGPRGVGKTTAARIFAKALNCEKPRDGEPCTACAACEAMQSGRLIDLIELDAATHTQVEKIREAIVEHVRFAPAMAKRKIYILDEAHMLSASSWNALLKTLEEPPPYAFFIFATTEWHKVPATVLSRCQRFEFRRVPEALLVPRLTELARREGWEITGEAAKLIASRADGCVRDTETLLGQLGALGSEKIDLALVSLVVPPSHVPLATDLMKQWALKDHEASLCLAEKFFDDGVALLPLFDDLLLIVRRLLGATAHPHAKESWENGTEEERAMAGLVEAFCPADLNRMALLLLERRRDVKMGVDPLFALQLVSTAVIFRSVEPSSEPSSSPPEPPKKGPPSPPPVTHQSSACPVAFPQPTQDASQEAEKGVAVTSAKKGLDLDAIRMRWNAFIRAVGEKSHSLPLLLKISRPQEVCGNTLLIRFQYPFHRDKVLGDGKHRAIVESCAREVFECPELQFDGVVGEDAAGSSWRSDDMVSTILQTFGGSLVES